jgi:hypothetical protein
LNWRDGSNQYNQGRGKESYAMTKTLDGCAKECITGHVHGHGGTINHSPRCEVTIACHHERLDEREEADTDEAVKKAYHVQICSDLRVCIFSKLSQKKTIAGTDDSN